MGILDLIGRSAQQMGGLLYPGFSAMGVDPQAAEAARRQAMMAYGVGMVGGQTPGFAYHSGMEAGMQPMEQARREALARAAAADRDAQAQERQRAMQEREAMAAREAALRTKIAPFAATGDYDGMARVLASEGMLQDASAAKGLIPKQPNPLTLSRGQIAIDPTTGQEIGRGLAPEPTQGPQPTLQTITLPNGQQQQMWLRPGETSGAPVGGPMAPKQDREKQKVEIQLSGNFQQQSQTHATVAGQYRRMVDLAAKPSAANDMALIYSFAKINDPNSVVRESEFAAAAKVGTYGQAVQVAANKVSNGEMLTPAQRQDFLKAAESQYKSSNEQWVQGVVLPAQQQAKNYGLNWGNIYKDYRVKPPETGGTMKYKHPSGATVEIIKD